MTARPHVVVHASISVDGSMTGFEPDLAAHYAAAAAIPAGARLIGSATLATGLDRDEREAGNAPGGGVQRPDDPTSPYWVVVDSTGRLQGRLAAVRAFPPVRDVLVAVSHATPDSYLQYLSDNRFRYLMTGRSRVDLGQTLRGLSQTYGVAAVVVDSGPTLLSALLDARLVDEVSLLVHPVAVGAAGRPLFEAARGAGLELLHCREAGGARLLLRYRVLAAP